MADFTFSVLIWSILFAFGASMGSFWGLVAYRLPRGESVVFPPSKCTSCQTFVPWYGLIPVLGWFLVNAKCKSCGVKVSPLHPLVETIAGLGTVHIVLHFLSLDRLSLFITDGRQPHSWISSLGMQEVASLCTALWFFYLAIPLVIIDLNYRILPNKLTLPGLSVAILLGAFNPELGLKGALLGAVVGGVSLWAVAKIYAQIRKREGLGFGDVKYLAFIGASVGWQKVFLCLGVSSFLGTFAGLILLLFSSQKRAEGLQLSIPFGPFLALGTLSVMLYGEQILSLLLRGSA